MPDIMMCDTILCPKQSRCYRNKASGTKPDIYRQSWWMRDETSPVGEDCHNFIEAGPLGRTHMPGVCHE